MIVVRGIFHSVAAARQKCELHYHAKQKKGRLAATFGAYLL